MEKTYGQLITEFKDTSLRYTIDKLDVKEYLSKNPDPFEVYLLAKFKQLDLPEDTQKAQIMAASVFENEIRQEPLFFHYFFSEYLRNIRDSFESKSSDTIRNFVPLRVEEYYYDKMDAESSQYDFLESKSVLKVLESKSKVTLIGSEGSGKSFTAEYMLHHCLDGDKNRNLVPIYVNLDEAFSIFSRINNFLLKYSNDMIDYETVKRCIDPSKLFFILDGVDELGAKNYSQIVALIQEFVHKHGRSKIMINTRPLYYFSKDDPFETPAYQIQPLYKEQQIELIKKYFDGRQQKAKAQKVIDHLEEKRFRDLMSTPQNLISACESYLESGQIPRNEGDIYNNLIQALEDRTIGKEKNDEYPLHYFDIHKLLEILAYNQYVNDEQGISEKRLVEQIRAYHPNKNEKRIINQLIEWGHLYEIEKRLYGFRHKSWEKYYAAKRLHSEGISNLKELVNSYQYDELIILLSELLPKKECKNLIKELLRYDWDLAAKCQAANFDENVEGDNVFVQILRIVENQEEFSQKRIRACKAVARTRAANIEKMLVEEINNNANPPCFAYEALLENYIEASRSIIQNLSKFESYNFKNIVADSIPDIGTIKEVPIVIKLLKDNDIQETIKVFLIKFLGKVQAKEAEDILFELLHDRLLQREASEALGTIGTPNIRKKLIKIIEDKEINSRSRESAIYSIGIIDAKNDHLDNNDKILKLIENDFSLKWKYEEGTKHENYLEDPDDESEGTLGEVAEAMQGVTSAMYSTMGTGFERVEFVMHIAYRDISEEFKNEIEKKYRFYSKEYQSTYYRKAIHFMMKKLREEDDLSNAISFFAQIQQKHIIPIFKKMLKSEKHDEETSLLLIQSITDIDGKEGTPYLIELLKNPNIRNSAAQALAVKNLKEGIIPIVEELKKTKDVDLLKPLCRYQSEDATKHILEFIKSIEDTYDQLQAIREVQKEIESFPKENQYKFIEYLLEIYNTLSNEDYEKEELYEYIHKIKATTQTRYLNVLGEEFA